MEVQTPISRAVRAFMAVNRLSQSELGRRVGLSQTAVSRRLSGHTRWSVAEIHDLYAAGVEVLPPLSLESDEL